MRSITLITPPATPVLSLAEAKIHLRVDIPDEDTYITMIVGAATRYIERTYGLAIIKQTLSETFDNWENVAGPRDDSQSRYNERAGLMGYGQGATGNALGYGIGTYGVLGAFLDRSGPSGVRSIDAVQVQDLAPGNAIRVLLTTEYQADLVSRPARVVAPVSGTIPIPYAGVVGGIVAQYTAGESDATTVPEDIKLAILMLVADLYENRSNEVTGTTVNKLANGLEMLLANWKLRSRS